MRGAICGGGFCSFAIDAMQHANLLAQATKEVDLITLRKKLDGGYGIFGGLPKDWAELEFSQTRAPWVRHERWHQQQIGTLHPDGMYSLKLPYADERELMGDILHFGV